MQTATYYSSIYNAVEDLADHVPGYHGEFPNQECIPAATAQTMDAWSDQACTWLSLQVMSHSVLTSTASQIEDQALDLVASCKVKNARL